MKILVAISRVPDTTAKISFTDGDTKFNESSVQWIINPYDEWYALVRAIELKEKSADTVIHLVTVGDTANDAILRKALALGGDAAFRVNKLPVDGFDVASQIAAIAKEEHYDLIFVGKESIDYNASTVGGMLAEMLDLPYVAVATKFELDAAKATVIREIEGGEETDEVSLPVVISCAKGMAMQRIPNMRGIMAARTKPLKIVDPVAVDTLTEVVRYELPPEKSGIKMIDADHVEELVRLLHEEAKVI